MDSVLTPEEVRELARNGRVAPDPTYHARQHHIRFDTVLGVLRRCFRVARDERVDSARKRRHPDGYVAWCSHWSGTVYRVDFNLGKAADGEAVLMVVTAMTLEDER